MDFYLEHLVEQKKRKILNSQDEEFVDNTKTNQKTESKESSSSSSQDYAMIELAYKIALLRTPTDEMIILLNSVGLKRTLDILLMMRQSTNPIKNPHGFIKKAIIENWSPQETHQEMSHTNKLSLTKTPPNENNSLNEAYVKKVPFYNWLEDYS